MFRIFDQNQISTYFLLPVVIILMNIRSIINGEDYADVALGLGILLILTIIVSRMGNNFSLSLRNSALPGLLFIILSNRISSSEGWGTVLVFAIFAMTAFSRLFTGFGDFKPYMRVFEGAFFFMIGILFWEKGVFFLPIYWLTLVFLNFLSPRCIVASILGAIVPIAFYATYLLWYDKIYLIDDQFVASITQVVEMPHFSITMRIYMIIIAFLILASLFNISSLMRTMKISQTIYFRVINSLLIFPIILLFVKYFSFEMHIFIAITGAYLLTCFVQNSRSYLMQELVVSGSFILSFITQFII